VFHARLAFDYFEGATKGIGNSALLISPRSTGVKTKLRHVSLFCYKRTRILFRKANRPRRFLEVLLRLFPMGWSKRIGSLPADLLRDRVYRLATGEKFADARARYE